MPLASVLQLYAPLAGLVVIAFWLGVLSQRVKQLEKEGDDHGTTHDTVVRLEEKVTSATARLDSMDRTLHNVNRQLANIATGRAGSAVYELGGSSDE